MLSRIKQLSFASKAIGRLSSSKPKPEDVKKADEYILQNIRSKDWSTFLVGNFLPKDVRSAFYAINWFSSQLGKIPETSRQPSLAMGKIEFWRGIVNRIYSGQNPNLEPISISLNWTCNNHPLTNVYFNRIMEARIFEVNHKDIESMDQLFKLTEGVRTSLIMLTLELLRIPITSEIQEVAVQAGRAIGVCDYIKRVPYNLRTYRLYLPNEITQKHNVSARNLWDRIHGKPREELYDVILEVASFSRECMLRAKKLQGKLPPQAFRAFLWLIQTELYLQNLQKANFNIFEKTLHQPPVFTLPKRLFSAARRKSICYSE